MGLAPQSAAKDASLRRRSGLSPAATSSAPATSPTRAANAGAACPQACDLGVELVADTEHLHIAQSHQQLTHARRVESTARAAASASAGSDLCPRRARRFGRSIRLDHGHILRARSRQARAVAAGALHPDTLHTAEAAQPSQQLLVARSRRRERRCVQQPPRRVDGRSRVRVAVGVHPAYDDPLFIWHNRSALLGTLQWTGHHRPERRTVHSRRLNRSSYQVTFLPTGWCAPPTGHRPTDRLQGTKPAKSRVRPAPVGNATSIMSAKSPDTETYTVTITRVP